MRQMIEKLFDQTPAANDAPPGLKAILEAAEITQPGRGVVKKVPIDVLYENFARCSNRVAAAQGAMARCQSELEAAYAAKEEVRQAIYRAGKEAGVYSDLIDGSDVTKAIRDA